MYPEDRVLIVYVPEPADFAIIQDEGWYRIPQKYAPKGLHAEYFAFYFGRKFGEQKWAVHYYAQQLGHELLSRLQLFPDQPDHPRVDHLYYKVQLGPLQRLDQPIVSLRWRRMTFLHTTWDRFRDAAEINDLLIMGGDYVDRLYATLKDRDLPVELNYHVEEDGVPYEIPLVIHCRNGRVDIDLDSLSTSDSSLSEVVTWISLEVEKRGGALL